MTDFQAIAQEAKTAINAFGAPATLTKSGTVDESGPEPVLVPGASSQVFVVQSGVVDKTKDGSNVRAGDVRFVVEATSAEPEIGDDLSFVGREYAVVSVNRIAPAGITVIYKVTARGA